MENKVFINETFDNALNDYISSKKNILGIKFNTFPVVVIRLLVLIFDELDILNPHDFNNESMLYNNLTKYGSSKENIERFMLKFDDFVKNENSEGFIEIQKMLIDMMMKKKRMINITSEDLDEFRKLLYSSSSSNPLRLSYNFLMSGNSNEVVEYFDKETVENQKVEIVKPKKKLNLGAYEILKYSIDQINEMDADELDEVNKKVYNYFEINANAVNSDYLLDKAVYEYNNPKPSLAGNGGFVNALLFLAVICTVVMIVAIVTLVIL